jgi:hypothetical protein
MHQVSVKVPIVYSAQVKNGKERNFREAWFGEWVELPLTVADAIEAPLAAEWSTKDIEKLTPVSVRVAGDNFYKARSNRHSSEQADIATFSNENDIRFGNAPVASAFAHASLALERMAYEDFVKGRMTTGTLADQKAYYGDTREHALATAQSILEGLLVIDDKLWAKTTEPLLSLTGDNSRINGHVTYEVEFPSATWQSPGHKFRLTEWEAMVAFGDILVPDNDTRENRWIFDKVVDLKVHIPEAFKAKVDLDAMVKLASDVLALTKGQVMDLGREATTYWHDVSDQLSETISTQNNADLDILRAVTERLVTATDHGPSARFTREMAAMNERLENRIVEQPGRFLER